MNKVIDSLLPMYQTMGLGFAATDQDSLDTVNDILMGQFRTLGYNFEQVGKIVIAAFGSEENAYQYLMSHNRPYFLILTNFERINREHAKSPYKLIVNLYREENRKRIALQFVARQPKPARSRQSRPPREHEHTSQQSPLTEQEVGEIVELTLEEMEKMRIGESELGVSSHD